MDFTHNFTATEENMAKKKRIFDFRIFAQKSIFRIFRGFQRREAAYERRSRWARSALSRGAAQAPKALGAKRHRGREAAESAEGTLSAKRPKAAKRLFSGAAAGRAAP